MISEFIKKIIIWKLNCLAWMYLRKYKPVIVAVTGNVGKTSTKEAVAAVLSRVERIRSGGGNLNNEFGVPLTIIGDWADEYYKTGNSGWFWTKVLWVSFWRWFWERGYPKVLVLEYGADRPKDIEKLCSKYKPHIAIVTAVGTIPVHVEFFSDIDGLVKEKAKLVECLGATDFAILNQDDLRVLEMKNKTKARVWSFGFWHGSTVKISNFDLRFNEASYPVGISFKLNYGENTFVPVKIDGSLGQSQAWASAAAACVGLIFKMNLVEISEALAKYRGPKGRLKILKGIKNSIVIDDTYNASPASTHLALETLKDLSVDRQGFSARKITVLGDMLELGEFTEAAHREVGNFVGSFVDVLVCVGPRSVFIADSAYNQMPKENIYKFATSNEAKKKVQDLVKEGDLVLVKGSQGMRMEKIVEEIMAEPEKKKELLVRQGRKWLSI